HGWSEYNADKPLTLSGTIEESGYMQPHGFVRLKTADKTWLVVLAPPGRMENRGLPKENLAVGGQATVVGYPHRSNAGELRAERAVATDAAGLGTRPHGPEWYAWGLRAGTTTRRSATELHAMGRARLTDLQAQMDAILRQAGLTQGSVAERTMAYQRRPGIGFPDGDEGRRQIVAYMQGRIDA
ncbi:DUF885 family protein, partial [Staphylococcus aureus]|nr:DUF885 family protein [Staphylococcus aureus]